MRVFVSNIIIFTLITGSWTFYKNDVLERTKDIQSGWNSDLNNALTSGDKLLIPIDQEIFKNIFLIVIIHCGGLLIICCCVKYNNPLIFYIVKT